MALNWLKKKKKAEDKEPANRENGAPTTAEQYPEEDSGRQGMQEGGILNDDRPVRQEQQAGKGKDRSRPSSRKGLFARLKQGLAKTRKILTSDIDDLFRGRRALDDEMLEQLEELLITSDIGVRTTMELVAAVAKKARKIDGPEALKQVLKEEILKLFEGLEPEKQPAAAPKPEVVMVVGVNGVGKTTTIGKLAAKATAEGKSVLIAAADTFRAAAIEQLAIWSQRAGAEIIKHRENADPAAVAFDSVHAAMARGTDLVLIDTAGRLHTRVNLMEELKKIRRSVAKNLEDAPHQILLVLDATTGQNALSQAKIFNEALGVSGLVLTKLDGTAKGGIVVSICNGLKIPLRYIGVGEGIDDLQVFDPARFVEALF